MGEAARMGVEIAEVGVAQRVRRHGLGCRPHGHRRFGSSTGASRGDSVQAATPRDAVAASSHARTSGRRRSTGPFEEATDLPFSPARGLPAP